MNASVLIDLGDDWSVAEDAPTRRRPSIRTLLTGVGLLALLLPGAAAAPDPAFHRLASIPVLGQVSLGSGPGTVFVGEPLVDGGPTVSAYSIFTGKRLWTSPVPDPPESLRYIAPAGVLAVTTFEPVPNISRLTVLDAGTGRTLWGSSGYLLWSWPPDNRMKPDEPALLLTTGASGPQRLRLVRMRTGEALWSRPVPEGSQVELADGASPTRPDVLVIDPDGTVTVLAHDTGAVLGARTLPGLSDLTGPDDRGTGETSESVVQGQLIVERRDGSLTTLVDYDLPGLTERWRRSGDFFGFPDDCGPVLCVGELDRLIALDREDGTVRWAVDRFQGASLIGGDRLLGYRFGDGADSSGVLDARTGRLLLRLGTWSPVATLDTSRLMSRPDTTDYRYTWFAALDPDRGVIQPLARMSGIGVQGCLPGNGLLLCGTLENRVSIWRYAS